MSKKFDGIVLFSGGLDSILAARLLMEQGLNILCLHFKSPFFGDGRKIGYWRKVYNLEIEPVDASQPFVKMLAQWPPHDLGKTMNPCLDCKIMMLELASQKMREVGAKFIATGEVLGQRPMSQRKEALNTIKNESGIGDILLRPLCAKLLEPTEVELSGLVPREKMLAISGRGRNPQLDLAKSMGIVEIPNPGGGCRLTEPESARKYWPIIKSYKEKNIPCDLPSLVQDLAISNHGRALFRQNGGQWLCISRNERDNERIMPLHGPDDLVLRLPFPGPLALARRGRLWPEEIVKEAASILASYAPPKYLPQGPVNIRIQDIGQIIPASPGRHEAEWGLPGWDAIHGEIKAIRKEKAAERTRKKRKGGVKDEDSVKIL